MKHCLIAVLCLFTISLFGQKMTDTIHSKMGDREITIGIPASYKKSPSQRYPLLLLLDGDYLFDPFDGALKYGNYWDDLPEMIIVGINQSKDRDADTTSDPETGLPEGQGEKFFEFVGEVVSAVEKNYRVSNFRIIAGHDLTAGFLNYYLYKDNPLFNAYISMSPDLPTGMEEQIPERLAKLQQPIFYYQSTADGDLKKMQKRIKTLDEAAQKVKRPALYYKFDEFKGASHYSLVLHSIPNALYHFFSVYQPISSNEFNEKIAVLPSGYVDYLIAKYDMLDKTLGMKFPIRINDFKAIEAAILKNKKYEEFDKLSELAKKNYPKSMLADYHLAMMYEKTGDLKKAIKYYQNAFQKEEIGDLTKDMMLDKSDELKKM
ncbi:MAG: alpha/beta hydrolase [Flavobacterium sp.]|nr:MAG: alpha/beta hydrolase [Flavobacterium sp.]